MSLLEDRIFIESGTLAVGTLDRMFDPGCPGLMTSLTGYTRQGQYHAALPGPVKPGALTMRTLNRAFNPWRPCLTTMLTSDLQQVYFHSDILLVHAIILLIIIPVRSQ